MPRHIVFDSHFPRKPLLNTSKHVRHRSSGQIHDSRAFGSEPERVTVDLSQTHRRPNHRRNSSHSYGGRRNNEALFPRSGAPSSLRNYQSTGSWQDNHHPPVRDPFRNDSWRDNHHSPVQDPSRRFVAAKPSSFRVQSGSRSNPTPHGENQARVRYTTPVPAPIPCARSVSAPDRGRSDLKHDTISSSIDRQPSLTPFDSISMIGSCPRRYEDGQFHGQIRQEPPRHRPRQGATYSQRKH